MPQPRRPRTHTAAVAVEPDAKAVRGETIRAVRATRAAPKPTQAVAPVQTAGAPPSPPV